MYFFAVLLATIIFSQCLFLTAGWYWFCYSTSKKEKNWHDISDIPDNKDIIPDVGANMSYDEDSNISSDVDDFYSSNFQVFLTLINIMIIVKQYLLSSGMQELLFIFGKLSPSVIQSIL